MNTIHVHDLDFELYLTADIIQRKIAALALEIEQDYFGKEPLFIGVLNGAFMLVADLLRHCNLRSEITFVKLNSYAGTESTEDVKTIIGLDQELKDRHVIVVEDIIDTGRTMHHFLRNVQQLKPASVKLVSLLAKPEAMKYPVQIDYLGFEVPNLFVVGYGLDYDGLARNLNDIYQLKTDASPTPEPVVNE